MTQEDKEILLKDLCARLPYKVKFQWENTEGECSLYSITPNDARTDATINSSWRLESCKPYLRPMSSMTEEEKEELYEVSGLICYDGLFTCKKLAKKQSFIADTTDWLNAHHFDYRGLIEKGLALEAPEGMYK